MVLCIVFYDYEYFNDFNDCHLAILSIYTKLGNATCYSAENQPPLPQNTLAYDQTRSWLVFLTRLVCPLIGTLSGEIKKVII